jgi:hypothetical protein
MAIQQSSEQGVRLHDVWHTLHTRHPDPLVLAHHLGWNLAHLQPIDTYRDCQSRYHFVTVDQVRDMFCASGAGFDVVSVQTPSYQLGERCPLVVYRRGSA